MRQSVYRAGWVVLVLLLLVQASSSFSQTVITSSVNDREHRYLELENGLKVLLVHDGSADKAAAALDVYIGSADNPKDRPGLAHFLEHMLFLGTEKYPEPDAYQAFVNANGGSHNAFTATEHTNYFFEVRAEVLAETLDRFAQFFIEPLFTPEYVARERNAVHSEFTSKIKDDFRRGFDAVREIAHPDHPNAQFRVGNAATLADRPGDSVREDLIQFYESHYSADNMALVVLGKESLDELEKLATDLFSQVPKREHIKIRDKAPLFEENRLPLRQSIVPEQELRSLSLLFPVPHNKPYYRIKPLDYIANLVGHEGPGSIIDVLKGQGWVERLSAGFGLDDRFTSSFLVNINLTEAGWQNREQVVAPVFAGIEQIRDSGVKKWRYQEQKALAELAFQYQEKQDPRHTVSSLANRLHEYPVEDVYRGSYLFEQYDAKLIKDYLSHLTPDNLLLLETAPEVKADKTSQFYKTPYAVSSLENKQWPVDKKLAKALKLPEANPFIPEDLKLLAESDESLVRTELANTSLWHKRDVSYNVPRGVVNVRLLLPNAGNQLENAVMAEMYTRMVTESLNSFTYPALLAGLHFTLNTNTRGLDIQIDGYTDKQSKLIDEIITYLTDFRLIEPKFDAVQQQLIREWRNAAKQVPYTQLFSQLSVALFTPQWSHEQKLSAITELTKKDLKRFSKEFLADGNARVLVYGNFSQKQASNIARQFDDLLKGKDKYQQVPAEVVKLEDGSAWLWHSFDHPDQALVGYLQGHNDSLKEQAYMMVLKQVVSSGYFNELRTEQQLGYVVFASNATYKKVPGAVFVVQSPSASVQTIHEQTQKFLTSFSLESEQEFDQHRQGLLVELMKSPKNLREQAGFYWDSIIREHWSLDYRQQMAKEIENLSLKEFNQFFQSRVINNPRWLWLAGAEDSNKPKTINWLKNEDALKQEAETYQYQ